MKKIRGILCCGILCFATACGNANVQSNQVVKETTKMEQQEKGGQVTEKKEQKKESQEKRDHEVGLLTLKVDYKFLQRYPQVFKGAQIHFVAEIKKIISSTDDDYQALAVIYDTVYDMDLEEEEKENTNYVILNGKQQGMKRVIEGDFIQAYGRYRDVDSYTIDGAGYTVPTMDLYDTSYINDQSRFNDTFIKAVAKAVFGSDIEVRNAVAGEDYTDSELSWKFAYDPYMICELENQSNSKFTKFRFYTERGLIDDAKAASSEPMLDLFVTNIVRQMEFTPDLQHYLVFTYDTDLGVLNIDYYDREFKKIWNREFEKTLNAAYDYTEQALYLVANNDMYCINLEDGQDIIDSVYVGEKSRVFKVEDGIILFSNSMNDTVMKVGLDGEIVWKTNTSTDHENYDSIQRLNGHIVISSSSGWNFIIVNEEDGSLEAEIDE